MIAIEILADYGVVGPLDNGGEALGVFSGALMVGGLDHRVDAPMSAPDASCSGAE